jgi:hypothetical protein
VIPLRTLFRETQFKHLHMEGKSLNDFGLRGKEDILFEVSAAGLPSTAKVEPGVILHNTLSKRKLNANVEKLAVAIEGRYKSHTKEALPLKKAREFKYFKFNQRRQTLYMFNPADINIKYSYKAETKY